MQRIQAPLSLSNARVRCIDIRSFVLAAAADGKMSGCARIQGRIKNRVASLSHPLQPLTNPFPAVVPRKGRGYDDGNGSGGINPVCYPEHQVREDVGIGIWRSAVMKPSCAVRAYICR